MAQRDIWKKFLDQQMQSEEAMTETQSGWDSWWRQSREKEQQNYDEARADMQSIFSNRELSGGQRTQNMPTSVSAGGGSTPGEVAAGGGGGTPSNPNRGTRRRPPRR